MSPKRVKAAGGVVLRQREAEREVAVVHRPKYDDWSLPKGKLDRGESFEDAALREVREETGQRCQLGRELDPVTYTDHKGRPKLVRWWVMEPTGGAFEPDDEVDELRWLPLAEAKRLVSYEHDRELIEAVEGGG